MLVDISDTNNPAKSRIRLFFASFRPRRGNKIAFQSSLMALSLPWRAVKRFYNREYPLSTKHATEGKNSRPTRGMTKANEENNS